MKRFLILFTLASLTGLFAVPVRAQSPGEDSRHEQRRREKDEKRREYCLYMDSLIRSGVYIFRPVSMQMQPAGRSHQIVNAAYNLDVREDYIDVHLPFLRGFMPPYRMTVTNYTLPYIPEYRAEQSADGEQWTITFSSNLYSSTTYDFKMTVTTCTGDAQLEISASDNNTVTYDGSLSRVY